MGSRRGKKGERRASIPDLVVSSLNPRERGRENNVGGKIVEGRKRWDRRNRG